MFLVRPARATDADAASALLEASYGALLAGWYAPAVLEKVLPKITRANPALLTCGTWYVAEAEDRLLGCGGWTRAHPATGEVVPRVAHLRHFGTHPDATRRGIGRALAERSFAEAAAEGITTFECASTLGAESFYAALGFVVVERKTISMGLAVDFSCVMMTCAR